MFVRCITRVSPVHVFFVFVFCFSIASLNKSSRNVNARIVPLSVRVNGRRRRRNTCWSPVAKDKRKPKVREISARETDTRVPAATFRLEPVAGRITVIIFLSTYDQRVDVTHGTPLRHYKRPRLWRSVYDIGQTLIVEFVGRPRKGTRSKYLRNNVRFITVGREKFFRII